MLHHYYKTIYNIYFINNTFSNKKLIQEQNKALYKNKKKILNRVF